MLMCDPPEGWRFGFPRAVPEGEIDINAWLIREGYPVEVMKAYGDYFYCRYWHQDDVKHREVEEE